jgi:Carboxypeptidase regulatory-like domain
MTTLRRSIVLCALLLCVFTGAAQAQTVRGTVRASAGNAPAPYAIVVFTQSNREVARVITDQNGFYFVRSIPPGRYEVHIHRQNNDTAEGVDVPAAGGTFDFTVK